MFPRRNLFNSCSESEVDGVKLLGMGFHDIQGLILSHLWVPLLRASHILFLFLFLRHIFPSPFISDLFCMCHQVEDNKGH
jgi:hypothetical protein